MSVVSCVFLFFFSKRLNLMIQCAAGISRSPCSHLPDSLSCHVKAFYQTASRSGRGYSSSSLLLPFAFTVPECLLHCNHTSRSFATALSQHAVRLTPKRPRLVFFLVTCKLKNADSGRGRGDGTRFGNCGPLTVFVYMPLHENVWGGK